MTPQSVMIFAAGFGTRMGTLTADRPKPLIPVAGRALIDHALALTGARQVVVNTHYHAQMIQKHLATTNVRINHEPDILDTGGGLRAALPILGDGPVYTLNADAVWSGPNPLDVLADQWNPEVMDALLLLVPKANALGHIGGGDFISTNGRLERGKGDVYTGAQIIKTDGLADIPEQRFSLNLLWDKLLVLRRVYGAVYAGQWCDVGQPEGIATAEQLLGASHG